MGLIYYVSVAQEGKMTTIWILAFILRKLEPKTFHLKISQSIKLPIGAWTALIFFYKMPRSPKQVTIAINLHIIVH